MAETWVCGNLVDYRGLLGEGCIGIEEGRIARVAKDAGQGRVRDYRGRGLLVSPGFIDIHVHLRGLDHSYKETEETGGWAAARSGITMVVDMPNTRPPASTPEVVEEKLRRLSRIPVDHSLFAGVPRVEDLEAVAGMPIAGFKIYPQDLPKPGTRSLLGYWRGLVVLHPELPQADGIAEERIASRSAHRGCWLEAAAVREVALMNKVSRIHVTHASCPETVREAKSMGYTVDVTPHHILYDYTRGEGCIYKVNPPLRAPEDRSELYRMLLEGVIDALASDHAPHALWEKVDPIYCSPGIPWLEAWPWILYRLVGSGALSLGEFHRLASRGPATILGLEDYGVIEPGARANILVYDPSRRGRFSGPIHSMARHYPSLMEETMGEPVEVLVGGETVYFEGEPVNGVRGVNPFTSKRPSGPA